MPDIPVEPGNSGRYPSDMESRVAMLEQLARTTSLGLERLDQRMEGFDQRMGGFDRRMGDFDQRMGGLDQRMDGFDRRMDGFDRRLEGVERRMDVIIAGQRADFRWIVGLMLTCIFAVIGLFGTILGVMAHGFHWL